MSENGRLRRVGSLWKGKPGGKSVGSGNLTISGLRQRFVVLKNDKKTAGSQQPDYVLMSSDEPEVDEYASRAASRPAPAPRTTPDDPDDSIPF